MNKSVSWLDRKFYPDVQDNWDDHLFRELILSHCENEFHILDVGAGAGIVTQMNFKGIAARVSGIDPDPRVVENPYLDEGRVAMAEDIPFEDASFDLVLSDNVLEHLNNPGEVFTEINRVLKPNGLFLIKTPNKRHYVPLIARMTPHRFHRFFNRLRGREAVDTFPTRYKANSPKDLQRLSLEANLLVEKVLLVESRPEYLRLNPVFYVFGIFYERLVNRIQLLSGFRVLLMGVFRKPAETA
jgi:SAM-dependent methyltransferase